MVFRCVVYGCGNTCKTKDVAIHEFPRPSNKKRYKEWTKFVSKTRNHWTPTTSYHICSQHFEEAAFSNKMKYDMGFTKLLLLKKDSVPSIYPVIPAAATAKSSRPTQEECQFNVISSSQRCVTPRSAVRKREVLIQISTKPIELGYM
mgnify:CR=1 FL=1